MDNRTLLKNPLLISVAASIAVAVVLALLWRFTPLAEMAQPGDVIGWFRETRGTWWAPVAIVFAHLLASVVMFPRPLLTIAAVVAFGPLLGFTYSLLGVLISAAGGYYAGRLLDERRVKRMAGPRLQPLSRMLRKQGLMAVTLIRLLPVAPFTVESVVAGALRVKLWHLLVGTAIGMLPGMLGTTVLGDQLAAVFTDDRDLNKWVVIGVAVAMAALFWYSHHWYKRLEAQSD